MKGEMASGVGQPAVWHASRGGSRDSRGEWVGWGKIEVLSAIRIRSICGVRILKEGAFEWG